MEPPDDIFHYYNDNLMYTTSTNVDTSCLITNLDMLNSGQYDNYNEGFNFDVNILLSYFYFYLFLASLIYDSGNKLCSNFLRLK